MATTTARPLPPSAIPAAHRRVGLAGALRSEFTKIRSVRSTYWTLLALIVVTVGLGALFCWGTASHWSQMAPSERATFDATTTSLASSWASL